MTPETAPAEKPLLLIRLTLREVPEFIVSAEQVAHWQKQVPELELLYAPDQETFVKNLSRATYVMCYSFSEAWLPLTYRLKWIASPAAGKEVMGARIPERIRLTHGTFHGEIMSETVIGMLLALRHGIMPGIGLCTPDEPWPVLTPGRRMVKGSRAVILGYGNIGRAIGEKLEAFGVEVVGLRRADLPHLEKHLSTADALILALPAAPETDNILNAERIAHLPPHAVVINVGRGNAIDEVALCDALNRKAIFAAFLDVMKEEPNPPDSLLARTPRCYRLPHASAIDPNYLNRAFAEWLTLYRQYYAN